MTSADINNVEKKSTRTFVLELPPTTRAMNRSFNYAFKKIVAQTVPSPSPRSKAPGRAFTQVTIVRRIWVISHCGGRGRTSSTS